ncbi:MAG: hypothetical protein AB7O62_10055 [Pirellulales bacterium]
MDQILFQYSLNPTTWVYLSSLLTIALFFKFSRFWSVRNLDLIGLIAIAPGMLLVVIGQGLGRAGWEPNETVARVGYVWLFVIGALFLIRLLCDAMMVRRPLLEPNLTAGGLAFICISLLIFLFANVITAELRPEDWAGAKLAQEGVPPKEATLGEHGPGYLQLLLLPNIPSKLQERQGEDPAPEEQAKVQGRITTARILVILSHLAVVVGLVLIGYRHFDNIRTGIAVATLYLMLPYTAQTFGKVSYVLPAALLVWAIEEYRRPLVAGMFLGLATGAVFFPIFLLPLWISFYWQRGALRFLGGVASMLLLLVATQYFTAPDFEAFLSQVKLMAGWPGLTFRHVNGFWTETNTAYRITILVAYVAICGGMALWPARKNLGTLLSCSAAVMLGTQFWQANDGGMHVAWYLPLLVLTVFRPNLEDRMAISTLDLSWFEKRRSQVRRVDKAA